MDLDDSKAESADPSELVTDLSEIAAQCAASNLLDFATQLAGLAEDLKALAARPIEPVPTLTAADDQPEASLSSMTLKIEPSRQ
ncbi:hypothetical protein RWA06_30810 (plasmid) [Sinorhizobium meliloti]|uniref:hypothetical protein n=1 Tax=Rhizobium meliloti TaxID=382 RepID=UPI00299F2D78|nr:hypothetical protein [Sinorhizobium meliloti]MDW9622041.1 hypothetical protein [Sinorhizobium meliloti]MDX0011423.1 hypothetical protein [Sinorhizobium meliloti]MDX0160240.1 hypothetical protein [Sinorhizobium meliloti]MDX0179258.1 hypothetical protein [Sinorhizobium meliloti]